MPHALAPVFENLSRHRRDLIDQAADLTAHSAVVVHRNEPLWRRFHGRVAGLVGSVER